jgi:hypothetical protein
VQKEGRKKRIEIEKLEKGQYRGCSKCKIKLKLEFNIKYKGTTLKRTT